MKKILFLLTILCLVNTVFSQIDRETEISAKAEQKLGDLLYAQSHYYTAIQHYREVIREKPEWRYSKYWLAMAYFKAKDYNNAELWFNKFVNHRLNSKDNIKKIEKENLKYFNKARYFYGLSLKHNAKYSEAIKQLKAFKSVFVPKEKKKKDIEDINWIAKANIEIKGAELGIKLSKERKKVKIANLGNHINTSYEEASPMPINDSLLYYTSLNKDRLIYIEKAKDIPPYRILQSKKVNGVWQKGKELPSSINDEEYSTGNVAISEDGKRMYFCKCYNNEVDEIICAIHFSQKEDKRWSEAIKLNSRINDPNFTSTQPSIRSSGGGWELVYFVSDRDGGKGGMDIWYFIRTKKGDFKGPRLLRGPINTKFDELTPFYNAADSSFYFSSNGHPSIGGFDVFVSTEDDEMQWIKPQNIGAPINSTADDLYYKRIHNQSNGFFVSNRDGSKLINKRYRSDDLYSFRDYKFGLKGLIVKDENDKSGKTIVEKSTIKLYTENLEGEEILVEEIEVINGEYFLDLKPDKDYKIEVVKPGFSSSFEYISTKNMLDEDTISKDLSILKSQVVATGSLYNASDSSKNIKLGNALVTLIEVEEDGSYKELRVVKISDKKPNYYFELDLAKKYIISVTKDGYFANNIEVDFSEIKDNQDTISNQAMMTKIELGKSYALDNILYEFGKAELTENSKKTIESLAKIMTENPLIVVELSAHTDAVGSDEANLKLSQSRAQSCVDYLVSKGLSETRLVAKGYGESKPIAKNINADGSDNEEGRAKNRRTEFKVIGGL